MSGVEASQDMGQSDSLIWRPLPHSLTDSLTHKRRIGGSRFVCRGHPGYRGYPGRQASRHARAVRSKQACRQTSRPASRQEASTTQAGIKPDAGRNPASNNSLHGCKQRVPDPPPLSEYNMLIHNRVEIIFPTPHLTLFSLTRIDCNCCIYFGSLHKEALE